MNGKRVLLTGLSGSLGWTLGRFLAGRGFEIVGTYRRHRPEIAGIEARQLSLEDPAAVERLVQEVRPQVVVHTAAMTDPDSCERDPVLAGGVNVGATGLLARIVAGEALLIFTSTDLVFNGTKGGYTEDDEPSPVNFYGETKVQAERQVRIHPRGVVLRIAKLYSYGSPFHPCFSTWMRDRFSQNREVPLYRDQYRSPLFVEDAARAILRVIEDGPGQRLYHLGGPDRLSRLEFGEAFARTCGYDRDLIRPLSLQASGLVARGADCSLDSTRFGRDYGFTPHDLESGLSRLKREWERGSA